MNLLILKNKMFLITVIIVFLIGGCLIFKKSKPNEIYEVKKGDVLESVYGIGTVKANKSYQIKLGVTATISQLLVKEGDEVKNGQKLLILDDNTSFNAPFDGTVTALPYKVGETVFAQTSLLDLVDLKDRYLLVSLEQRGALRVRKGQEALLSFDGLRDQNFKGTVNAVYSNDTDYLVRIDAADLPPQILPGMTADVAITISMHRDCIVIPITALDDNKVYVDDHSGHKKAIEVKTGLVDGEMAEIISSNLNVGQQLVLVKK